MKPHQVESKPLEQFLRGQALINRSLIVGGNAQCKFREVARDDLAGRASIDQPERARPYGLLRSGDLMKARDRAPSSPPWPHLHIARTQRVRLKGRTENLTRSKHRSNFRFRTARPL